jgi:hypothetical protein
VVHSPFAKAFIDALSDNRSIIDGLQLFGKMRRPVGWSLPIRHRNTLTCARPAMTAVISCSFARN